MVLGEFEVKNFVSSGVAMASLEQRIENMTIEQFKTKCNNQIIAYE